MKFSGLSEELFGTQTSVRVLRELIRFPTQEATGRQIARSAGTPVARTLEALNRFERHGLVDVRGVGRSQVWTLRREHTVNTQLTRWFDFERSARTDLVREIGKVLSPLAYVRRAMVFGSVARGDERPSSDVDLAVIIDDRDHQSALETALGSLRQRVRATFGNPLSILIYDQEQWAKNRNRPVARNIERDGLVVVDRPMVRTEHIEQARAAAYWKKATDFQRTSRRAAEDGDWNGAALMAVHAVISAADALTVYHLQLRSKDPDHEQASKLVQSLPLEGAREKATTMVEVLENKNVVAYQPWTPDSKAIQALMKKADRFLAWAGRHMEAGES